MKRTRILLVDDHAVVRSSSPGPSNEKLSVVEWTLEEKRAHVAEMIINQPQQPCFLKLHRTRRMNKMAPHNVFSEGAGLADEIKAVAVEGGDELPPRD